jgi:protein TonB
LVSAQGSFGERDFERALKRYRKLAGEECSPEGTRRLCCAALLGEAEALLALQERQAALKSFERCRQECPTDVDVRRRLYLAEHASDPEADPATVTSTFTIEHVLGGLGERDKVLWVGLFLDGEFVGHEPLTVHPGSHDLEAEILLEARGPDKSGAMSPVRLRARQPVSVPGPSYVRLTLAERADASLAEDRMTLEMEVKSAADVAAAAPKPSDPAVASKLNIDLRVSGNGPKFPAELARHGDGWKVRSEICVGPEGRVRSVRFLDAAPAHDPRVDAIILETLRRWRYGAYRIDSVLTGFCHNHEVDLAAR